MRTKLSFMFAVLLAAVSAVAHHGTGASYDLSNPRHPPGDSDRVPLRQSASATFSSMSWTRVKWSIGVASFIRIPLSSLQGGWGRKRSEAALAPGTKITVTVAPARAGTKVGAIAEAAE